MAEKKPKALPKSLGACADLYHDTREKRLALNKEVEAIKAEETRIADHIINNLDKDSTGAVGKRFIARVVREKVPVVADWEKFYEHVRKTKSFDLLNKALNRAAVKERYEAGKNVPGVESFDAVKLSITKAK